MTGRLDWTERIRGSVPIFIPDPTLLFARVRFFNTLATTLS